MSTEFRRLFDDVDRFYTGYMEYAESQWGFLNRSVRAQYIRDLMQNWFDTFEASSDKKRKLCSEFRSEDNKQHLSAFFELYLFHLFQSLGFGVEVEPEWPQGTPDFLLTAPNGRSILLEATAVYPDRWFSSQAQLENQILDYINKNLNTPDFILSVEVISKSVDKPSFVQILNFVREKLSTLDYDQLVKEAGIGSSQHTVFVWRNRSGWIIHFLIFPKYKIRGIPDVRPIGVTSYSLDSSNIVSSIKASLDRKYRRYGDVKIPYLLAINFLDGAFHPESLIDGLHNTWMSPSGPQKTRMSGVCVFANLLPASMHVVSPTIWHHPYASNPLESQWLELNQQVPKAPANSVYSCVSIAGRHPKDILGIDETKWL